MNGRWMLAMVMYAIARRSFGAMAQSAPPQRSVATMPPLPLNDLEDLIRAANNGDAEAQYRLGVLGLVGKLGPTGRKKCRLLLSAAAMQNHPGACFVLGMLYQHGALIPQDRKKAVHLFQRAAGTGHARAQNALAQLMLIGNGVARDRESAITWFETAAAQGLPEAKANLGALYIHDGDAVAERERGMALMMDAAENGIADAQHFLGQHYHNDARVPQDFKAACKWYNMAADRGLATSQYNLALLLLRPRDERFNPPAALKWLLIVATSQNTILKQAASRAINELAPQLSPVDVASATEAALLWQQQRKQASLLKASL
ncbi:tetratricopeptide repeat protein [Ferrovibrio sp.]|uniref:tetratricopeptide repeat protein n=1 Tax=Ferrovibrio sp. TaxID=1917215 RepID=UPI001B40AB85|nr:tetratricopeptide repeat protein [Ferrovibrio sp.]MBP7063136.1 sel1 repeat family protein [Ferrovibrio sp.]